MKNIQILTLIIVTVLISGCSSKKDVVKTNNKTIQKKSIEKTYTLFEKKFINHLAYNHYKNALRLLYEKKHTLAYDEAIAAKKVYNNSLKKEKIIELPYIPGYVRESAQTPKRIYYKIVKEKVYEINRLIRKIKLLNPPIPYIILNKTSTYIDITVLNFGDTPLDNLEVEINYERVALFDKINPNKSKTIRFAKTMNIEQISFKEEYGFAPSLIQLEQKIGE